MGTLHPRLPVGSSQGADGWPFCGLVAPWLQAPGNHPVIFYNSHIAWRQTHFEYVDNKQLHRGLPGFSPRRLPPALGAERNGTKDPDTLKTRT